jgi:23S rRNA (uracil1939-C5)-methyltransferase
MSSSCLGRGVADVVRIESLGHRGDGIARSPEGPLYVPFTLPGERVLVERDGERTRMVEIVEPSAERVSPSCRHFGRCGGCALQMLPLAAARRLKRDFVVAALAREGLDTEVAETVGVALSSRRRAVLTALRVGKTVLLGYSERLSNRLVDIEECPVLVPALARRLGDLKSTVAPLVPAGKPVRVTVLATDSGLDADLAGAAVPEPRLVPKLAERARAAGIARLSIGGEPALSLAEPVLSISGVAVVPPPGAFVQASAEAERIMADLVVAHHAGARRVADLFSGIGTFALALARQAQVHAVEVSRAALDALGSAARNAKGLKRIETERRDLFAFPLAPAELVHFDGVVFDPPRAGAKAQAAALAASKVPRIAAVSCNPASFARDARILVDGGYALERVVPVDQFVYSAETEVVGLFSRA